MSMEEGLSSIFNKLGLSSIYFWELDTFLSEGCSFLPADTKLTNSLNAPGTPAGSSLKKEYPV